MAQLLLGLAFDIFSALSTALSTLFSIFMTLASTSTTIIDISNLKNNIYILLTVVMVFYITISLMTYLVSPDKLTDKSAGGSKLIIKIVITLVLLVFTPTIFSISRDLQTAIIKENILGKIIISDNTEYNDENFMSVSHQITEVLVMAFLRPVDEENALNSIDAIKEQTEVKDEMYDTMFFSGATSMSELRAYAQDDAHYSFNWLMAILCSGVLCLLIFGFLFDIAVRLIKLSFMELIAPIPIISNVSVKKNETLNKWVKNTVSTYASLFIRLIIIFFFLYVITNIDVAVSGSVKNGTEGNPVIYTFVIIGALLFAKQLPKLLQDILGIKLDGNFTLNPMRRIREVPLLGSAVQTTGAAVGGLVTGTALGFRAAGGFKGIGKAFADGGFKEGMKNLGTMTGMSGRGMIFGGRAGFQQTKLLGVAAKDQKIDKSAYRAGASSVAQAITGNSDASAGFPDRMFNNMATHLNDPTYKQTKAVSDAEKDYEKVVQEYAVLQESERDIKSNLDVSIERKNSLHTDLTRINTQLINLSNPTTLTARIASEKTRIQDQIRNATVRLSTTTNADDITALQNHIDNLKEQLNGVDENVQNEIRSEISTLTTKRDDVQIQYNEANAAVTSYTKQHNDITTKINGGTIIDPTTGATVHVNGAKNDVAEAKQKLTDQKDKLKYQNANYNKRT